RRLVEHCVWQSLLIRVNRVCHQPRGRCDYSATCPTVAVPAQIARDLFEFREKARSVLEAHEHVRRRERAYHGMS
ncbi:MAG: hypothetical protein Q9M13_06820, partial [Mariprofundales bacterium]|nr:hypothetical protein [Mariprofundales bacterium]